VFVWANEVMTNAANNIGATSIFDLNIGFM